MTKAPNLAGFTFPYLPSGRFERYGLKEQTKIILANTQTLLAPISMDTNQ